MTSLAHLFLHHAETSPDKTFIHFEGDAYSYADLFTHVSRAAGSLRARGLRKGERVALYLENLPSFIVAYLGALWLGGVVVLVNTRYRETELRYILGDSGARLVVTDAERAGRLGGVLGHPGEVDVIQLGQSLVEDDEVWRTLAPCPPLTSPADLTPDNLTSDDLAVIAYTSGTTGRAKGATLTHGNFVSNSRAVTRAWGWTADDHLLLTLPLFHMHGLGVGLHGTLVQGSALTLKRTFDAADVLNEIRRGRVTMFFGVPTMHTRLLQEVKRSGRTREEVAGLRLLVSGSAPLSPQIMRELEAVFRLPVLERYGMTETVMNLGNPLRGERKAGSVGVPFAGVQVRVVDKDNNAVTPGTIGELQLRGPNVTKGYWNKPAETEASFVDGWFKTGDLGFMDEDGYYFLTGRAKELIISGGFNVYPREVEEVLAQHGAVQEVAVLGLPDDDLVERVVAAVVVDGKVEASKLQAFCKEKLASFKKPKEVFFVDELPRNALGKVQKHVLREKLESSAV